MLNIQDAQNCAQHFKDNFIDKYYIITTSSGNELVLKAEEKQFPHLIGITRQSYVKHHLTAKAVYDELLSSNPVLPSSIIGKKIKKLSKKGIKIKNFQQMNNSLLRDRNTLCIAYNEVLSILKLSNIDYLFSNYKTGFSSGWVLDSNDNYCKPVSWIDESNSDKVGKEKYYLNQTFELVEKIEVYDSVTNKLLASYFCDRSILDYLRLLLIMKRNKMTLKVRQLNQLIKFLSSIGFIKVVN